MYQEMTRQESLKVQDDFDQALTNIGLMSEKERKYNEIYRRKDAVGQKIMRLKKKYDDEWEKLSPQEKKRRLEKSRIDEEVERKYR